MLKFLRKYQKWMLVVFCGALMVAFLIPQAVSQFAPNPAKAVLATTYDGQEITRAEVQRVSSDVQMLRRLRIEALPALSIIPQTGSERDDALSWILIQRAAEHNGLGASQQEAFNLIGTVMGLQDFESLDVRAKEIGANANYLIELGRQYLVAEQYRQLVSGIEYNLPDGEDETTSPGVRRVVAMQQANLLIQQLTQNPQMIMQMAMSQGVSPDQFLSQILVERGVFTEIQGHERFSVTELRYALQREFSEIDLTVVVLGADDRLDTTSVDEAYIQGIFDRFADDDPGTGEPYGLGYREPHKVQLEALRIPIEAAREAAAKKITPEDVRKFYDENRVSFIEEALEVEEGEEPAIPQPAKLTADLRDQIRLALTQIGAEKLVVEVAQKARQRLNEDARGLPDDGVFKALPDDFKPTPLTTIAAEIEAEHGFAPELIMVDEFVSPDEIVETTQFTQAWLTKMPTSTVKMPDQSGFGFLIDREVPETVLGGRAGLFASFVPELSNAQRGQLARLADYVRAAQPFLTDEQLEQTNLALQVGLPGMVLSDMTRSTYVFRITQAQPSRPATELAPIAEQVREEAIKVKAYEDLIAEQEALLTRADGKGIESLMPNADAKNTLSGLTRGSINQRFAAMIQGVGSSRPILERAFAITDDLVATGGFDQAQEADRLFAVELPGDYKLALVRIDTFRPMTRDRFEEEAVKPASQMMVTSLGVTELPESPMSFEALQRYTGFKWDDDFEPNEDEEGAEEEGDDAEAKEEDE